MPPWLITFWTTVGMALVVFLLVWSSHIHRLVMKKRLWSPFRFFFYHLLCHVNMPHICKWRNWCLDWKPVWQVEEIPLCSLFYFYFCGNYVFGFNSSCTVSSCFYRWLWLLFIQLNCEISSYWKMKSGFSLATSQLSVVLIVTGFFQDQKQRSLVYITNQETGRHRCLYFVNLLVQVGLIKVSVTALIIPIVVIFVPPSNSYSTPFVLTGVQIRKYLVHLLCFSWS